MRIRCFSSSFGANTSRPASLISSFILFFDFSSYWQTPSAPFPQRFLFLPPAVESGLFCSRRHVSKGVLPRVGNNVFRFANRDIRKRLCIYCTPCFCRKMNSRSCAPRSLVRPDRQKFPIDELCRGFRSSVQQTTPRLLLQSGLVQQLEVPQVLLLRFTARKIHQQSFVQQSPSRRFPGPPEPFSAELSRPADTTQPRIRATILGTLHSPGADSLNERQPPLRYRRNATMAPPP